MQYNVYSVNTLTFEPTWAIDCTLTTTKPEHELPEESATVKQTMQASTYTKTLVGAIHKQSSVLPEDCNSKSAQHCQQLSPGPTCEPEHSLSPPW